MPTDTEIWNAACERVGLWKRGQRCRNNKCGLWCDDDGTLPNWQAYHPKHDIPAPSIRDTAAMVEWLAPSYAIIKKIGPNWQINSGDWSPTLPLALAAAVLAVPQETQP